MVVACSPHKPERAPEEGTAAAVDAHSRPRRTVVVAVAVAGAGRRTFAAADAGRRGS